VSKSLNDLVSEYRHNAVEHGRATETGDHKKANKHHDRLVGALHLLRQHGTEGEQALLGLLSDENASVRCWAATHSLENDAEQARNALEALSAQPGIIGFNARMVLSEWDKGTLKLP